MASHRFRSIIFSLLSLGILAGIVYYLSINANKYLHLLQLSALGVIAILALSLAVPLINGLINVYMFQSLGVNLSHREGFYLAASATFVNLLPLPGGLLTRGVYLKYRHSLSYVEYFSASLALFFCSVAVNGLIGIMILLYWILFKRIDVSPFLLIVFVLMAACLFVFWLPSFHIRLPGRIGKWVDQGLHGWTLISQNSTLLVRLLGLQTGFMLLFAVRQWIAFQMLSQNITISQAILLSSGAMLTQLVSFAPGGLGVREAIVGGIASSLGFDLTVSIAAVELDRVITTITIVLIGWISTVLLGRQVSGNLIKPGKPKRDT